MRARRENKEEEISRARLRKEVGMEVEAGGGGVLSVEEGCTQ